MPTSATRQLPWQGVTGTNTSAGGSGNGFAGSTFNPANLAGNSVQLAYDDNDNLIEQLETDVAVNSEPPGDEDIRAGGSSRARGSSSVAPVPPTPCRRRRKRRNRFRLKHLRRRTAIEPALRCNPPDLLRFLRFESGRNRGNRFLVSQLLNYHCCAGIRRYSPESVHDSSKPHRV